MAMWMLYHENTYLYKTGPAAQTKDVIRQVDDSVEPVLAATLANFGPGEVYSVESTDGEIVARIQYSPDQKPGWTRDHETPGEYIVQFRAVRQPG